MLLKAEEMEIHLQQYLLPSYFIFGDEQVLVEETSDLVRQHARSLGASDREIWHVEGPFNWSNLRWKEQTLSLFSSRRLLEIRLPSGSLGKDGSDFLCEYAANPLQDSTLLIISGKVDVRLQKSKWFSELDRIGATVPVWSVDSDNLLHWILQRMRNRGLSTNKQVAALIAERVEGNLFAAIQEIEQLVLLSIDGEIDEQLVSEVVVDNARFEAFGLMNTVFVGHVTKIPRIVARLRAGGLEFMSIFSALSWSLHRIIDMSNQLEQGRRMEQVFASQRPPVWQKSRVIIYQALTRHSNSQWQAFLQRIALIDQAAKGILRSCPWELLEKLCMDVANKQ